MKRASQSTAGQQTLGTHPPQRVELPKGRFRTEDLPLAAFLHCTRLLQFAGCEPKAEGRISFVFDDPSNQGRQLQTAFEAGAECPGLAFYESIRRLRKTMTRAHDEQEYEYKYEHEYRPHE